jgi:hypothetical protein
MVALRNLYIHDGWLRLRTPLLKGKPVRAAEVEGMLLRQTGVTTVKTNTGAGSIVVTFNSTITHHHEILRLLEYLGYTVDDDEHPSPADHLTSQLAQSTLDFALGQLH